MPRRYWIQPDEISEIREQRYENTVPLQVRLFEAVDCDNVEFRVFLANLECGLKLERIAPAFQRLDAFPSKNHDRAVR